jgi:hypothetical protein
MARIFKIKELEEKKRALAEECDLYRQTLRLEVHNLRLHASWSKRRFASFRTNPLWTILPPLLTAFLKRKKHKFSKFSKWRVLSTALAGWQLYRKFRGIVSFFPRLRRAQSSNDERAPAATI